ncbi:MAG: hypothetical protein V1800_07145 [Candidatus Latescibacterota bacterium]
MQERRKRTLFVDDGEVAQQKGLRRIVHPGVKCPKNPLLVGEMPWEADILCGGTVRKEDDEYRMWYQSYDKGTYINLYAQSPDGLNWHRPELGQFPDYDGNVQNNIFLSRLGLRSDNRAPVAVNQDHNPNVLYTPQLGADKRYTLISYDYARSGYAPYDGYCLAYSRDGIHWTDGPECPVIPGYADVGMFTFDSVSEVFRGIIKSFLGIRGHHRRSVFATESPDLLSWSFPRPAFIPDEKDDAWAEAINTPERRMAHTQIYGMPIFRYESMLIGFPQIFRITDTENPSHDGAVDIQLASSRDGHNWDRVGNRETIIPTGEPGSYDAGAVYTGNSLIVEDDEVRIYYTGCDTTHAVPGGTGVCMASWQRDRFVGLSGDSSGGYVALKPQKAGGTLQINADASGGTIDVTIPDSGVKERLISDKLDHSIKMPQHLIGQEVIVRLELKGSEVFSLWWE